MTKKQQKQKTIRSIFTVLLFLTLPYTLCCIATVDTSHPNYPKSVFPRSSAIYIRKDIAIKLCLPIPKDAPKGTKPMCMELALKSAGSGSVVKNTPNGSLVLTANHVCNMNLDIPPIFIIEKLDIKTKAFDIQGKEYDVEIGAFDDIEDMCLMKVKNLRMPSVDLSSIEPEAGDKIYNLSFPNGIYDIGLVMTYEGFYSGTMTVNKNKYATYSIWAVGGSSGSMLLDYKGKLVGMVHSGPGRVDQITFSPQYYILKNFLTKNIALLKNF